MSGSNEDDNDDYWSGRVDYLDVGQDMSELLTERFRQEEEERERIREEEERGRVNYEREELVGSDLEDDEFEGSEYEDSEIEEYGSKDDNEDPSCAVPRRWICCWNAY